MKSIIYEENGINWINVEDMFPNPTNTELYSDETSENTKQSELAISMRKEMEKGNPPNKVAVAVHPDGMIDTGHTRWKAAKQIGASRLKAEYTTSDYPDVENKPYSTMVDIIDTNIYREYTYSVKFNLYQSMVDAYEKENGTSMPSVEKKKLLKQLSTTSETIKKLSDIKDFRPSMLKDIDKGASSIEYCWKVATGQDIKVLPKKENGLDLFKLFDDAMKTRIISYAVNALKQYRNVKVSTKEGIDLSPIEDEYGWETSRFTGIVSDTFMWATGRVLKEEGKEISTANGHPTDPDVYLINEDEKIEVKACQFKGQGAATTRKCGAGNREGEFLLIAHDQDFTRLCIIFTTLMKDDWNKKGNVGTELTLKKWWETHKDKPETFEFWKGEVYEDSGTKQVQMSLESVDV